MQSNVTKSKASHVVGIQPLACSLEVTESCIRVTLTEVCASEVLVNSTIHNNSQSDVAEIKRLIKFHAPRHELITAGLKGDLFPVVLTGTGGQAHFVSFTHY